MGAVVGNLLIEARLRYVSVLLFSLTSGRPKVIYAATVLAANIAHALLCSISTVSEDMCQPTVS
jgi:hypothetical protein